MIDPKVFDDLTKALAEVDLQIAAHQKCRAALGSILNTDDLTPEGFASQVEFAMDTLSKEMNATDTDSRTFAKLIAQAFNNKEAFAAWVMKRLGSMLTEQATES